MTLRTDLSEAAWAFVQVADQRPAIDDIVNHLMREFADQLGAEGERAQREFVRRAAIAGLRQRIGDDSQPTLPGFGIPAAITVPLDSGRVVYVPTARATQEEWRAHRSIKEANIARAVDELRAYDELTDRLATVWADEPNLTVGECLTRLADEGGEE